MTESKRTIFISYRRADNPDFVERIRDWFVTRYGRDRVFMDFDSIPSFTHFPSFLRDKVAESDVIIAVIGPAWLDLLREKAANDDEDFVRLELELALQQNKLVAPVLIKGATMPRKADLPDTLRSILETSAAVLNSGRDFLDNIERIMDAVEQELARREQKQATRAKAETSKGIPAGEYRQPANARVDNRDYTEAGNPLLSKLMTAEEHLTRAYNRESKGDLEGALEDTTHAIELDPTSSDAFAFRAVLRRAKRDWTGALSDYSKVVRFFPNSAAAYRDRGHAYYDSGQYTLALPDFKRALTLDSDDLLAHGGLGRTYDKLKSEREALDSYEHYLQRIKRSAADPDIVERAAALRKKLGR